MLPRILTALSRQAPPVRRVVDLGIGTGDLVIALARAGYVVIGVDRSSAMLEVARVKLAASWRPDFPSDVTKCTLQVEPPASTAA